MVHYLFATDEQKDLAMGARQICEDLLRPNLEKYEHGEDGLGEYPMEVHNALAEAGYYGMNIPEEWGGLGLDVVTRAVITEQIAEVDAGFAFSFTCSGNYFPEILKTKLSDEEKQSWADRIASGEAIGCLALTEPGAGSDATAMRTTAVKDEATGDWIINGTKCFITNAPRSDYFLVTAWTDKTQKASRGVTLFFVERERGVKIGKKENKMGIKLSETAEVILEDVRVPADHIVGEEGRGFIETIAHIGETRCLHGIYSTAISQAAYDACSEYAKQRRQFGARIIDQQAVAFMIADMKARTETCRAMLYQTLVCLRDGIPVGDNANIVKLVCADNAMQTTTDAVQVMGGYGYMKDYPVEKLMRDAKIFQIFGGTSQILRRTIGRNIAGRDPQKVKA